jgi:hypothetical protein
MGGLLKSCNVSQSLKNTGIDCNIMMAATAMIVAVPPTFTFDKTDVDTDAKLIKWFKDSIHLPRASRIYPIFGRQAPIRFITNDKEPDILVTLDDGLRQFIRYGFLNRTFATTSGGLCYAAALQSFVQSGYYILEIDILGRMLVGKSLDGVNDYRGIICDFMYSPSPDLADFRNPAKTNFQVSYSPEEYVASGVLLSGAKPIMALSGLKDVAFELVSATTTKITIKVLAECSGDNLVTLLGTHASDDNNFIVIDETTGLPVTVTVAAAGSNVEITGTFVSGRKYDVNGASTAVTYVNTIEFFDYESASLVVLIP